MPNPLWLYIKALFQGWVSIMCSLSGLILSAIGWFFIPDTTKIRPFVILIGALALISASYRAWLAEHKKVTALQYPDITINTKEIIRTQHSSLFVHLSIFNLTDAPTLIQNCISKLTIDGVEIEGDATDDVATYAIIERIEDTNIDGELDWREITRRPLVSILDQITPNSHLKRGTHFTGWIRFYFGYSLDWPLDASINFLLIITDSYGRLYSSNLECPPYDPARIVERNKRNIKVLL